MTFNFKKYLTLRFIALFTFIFPLFLAPQKIYSSEYILTCANEDGFLSVFQIKNKSSFQSVTHISSYDPESGEKYSVNLPLQVISKDNNLISTVDVMTEDRMIILDIFNLDKKIISSNTIYLDGTIPDLQKYTCQ
tara:strand:+ start:841 stop:1245 length:405 start_codon:yes stop_codon:yes gene_type:complete